MFIYEKGYIYSSAEFTEILEKAEKKASNNCEQALNDLGFYPSSEHYPKRNIEGMGLQVYASQGDNNLTKKFGFLIAISACDTSTEYVLIENIPLLWDFLAEYLPVIKLANETMIDRETHYEQG